MKDETKARETVREILDSYLGDSTDYKKMGRAIAPLKYYTPLTGELLPGTIELAEYDPVAFDACHEAVREIIAKGESLPSDLRGWYLRVMDGVNERPGNQGRTGWDNVVRNVAIEEAVTALVEDFSFAEYSKGNQQTLTACDLVAQELQAYGIQLESVIDIWRERKEIRKRQQAQQGTPKRFILGEKK